MRLNINFNIAVVALTIIVSNSMCAQTSKQLKTYLALGDSYTIGESVPETERWPVQLAKALTEKGIPVASPKIIAVTGWRTDNLKNGIDIAQIKERYDLVSLLIGVNNQYQGKPADAYAVEYETLLKTAIQLAGGEKANVFVVSIPDYGYTPFGAPNQPKISKELDEFNAINKRITEAYEITYINITDISRRGLEDPELVADDTLHPSGKQYTLWVKRILENLRLE
ncbi:MAG TPA: SGNH/GDSL hydrolase family protein [Cyclobacteriaceae bacterium]|nr:SGNH/GDSL hydrolase family protein [Cyclobacteriaceae bacterium]